MNNKFKLGDKVIILPNYREEICKYNGCNIRELNQVWEVINPSWREDLVKLNPYFNFRPKIFVKNIAIISVTKASALIFL